MTFPTLAGWEPVYLWDQSKCTHESHLSRLLPLPPSLAANNSSLMPRVPAEAQAGRPVRAGSRAGATPQLFISSGCRQPSWIRAVCLSLWCQVFSCFSFSNENLNLTIARETQNQSLDQYFLSSTVKALKVQMCGLSSALPQDNSGAVGTVGGPQEHLPGICPPLCPFQSFVVICKVD